MVEPGQPAPDFAAPAVVDGEGRVVELFREVDAHEGVLLLFAPADFVGPCTATVRALREAGWHELEELSVLYLSPDSLYSHTAYAEQAEIPFPLVHDSHAGIADSYDLRLPEWDGHRDVAQRAAVAVDGDWEVLAVECAADPLSAETPPPVERAASAFERAGLDLPTPTIDRE